MSGTNSDWGVDREGLVGLMKAFPYTIHEAIADIIDNSIDANAKNITVEINHIQKQQYVLIKDDGDGIAAGALDDVISIGKRRSYKPEDLGHFGVGLKTAGLSQAENVTIFSKIKSAAMNTRRISVNWMRKSGEWDKVLHSSTDSAAVDHIMEEGHLPGKKGTTVLLENLHRFDAMREGENNDAHTIMSILPQLEAHLAMVFHRFLENPEHPRHFELHFPAMSEKIQPLDPLDPQNVGGKYGSLIQTGDIEISHNNSNHNIPVRLGILSKENHVSDSGEHRKRMTDAVGSWSNAEGAYLYRNDRLVAHSDWFGVPKMSKTAVGTLRRVSIELTSSLDDFFGLDPAKSNYRLPLDLRIKLKSFMAEKRLWVPGEDQKAFSTKAQHRYRTEGKGVGGKRKIQSPKKVNRTVSKPSSKHNDSSDSVSVDNAPSEAQVEIAHATSALIKPVSLDEHSSLISPLLKGQEIHIEVNMAHPWYVPFKQALKRWLLDD